MNAQERAEHALRLLPFTPEAKVQFIELVAIEIIKAGRNHIGVQCPNCGDPSVPIPVDEMDGLDCGMTIVCPRCKQPIVFGVFSVDEYTKFVTALEQRT